MQRAILFVTGLLVGIALDMLPHLVEVLADVNVCRESCSTALRGASFSIYVAMPILWGGLLAATTGKRQRTRILLTLLLASVALMLLLTWLLYVQQHPQ